MAEIGSPIAAESLDTESPLPHIRNLMLRRLVRPKSYLKLAQEVRDQPPWRRFYSHIEEYSERTSNFFLVQIGACDGVRADYAKDPIRRLSMVHNWSGLLVEPVDHIFRRLQESYANQPNMTLANVAVSTRNGTAQMLAARELPDSIRNPLTQMSSFHPEVLDRHRWMAPNQDELVGWTEVSTLTLPSLLAAHQVKHIDYLIVDTEGHDKVVLDQLNLNEQRPPFVQYEHAHLPRPENEELIGRFVAANYAVNVLRNDVIAELTV